MYEYYYGSAFTYLLFIIAMIFSLAAQFMVNSAFKKYEKVTNRRMMTGADAARAILDANGLYDVRIECIPGHLSDHFDPKDNVVRLSQSVFGMHSVAAIGVAAHECGHAVQHAEGYFPIKIRSAVIPMTRIGSWLAVPLVMLGLVFSSMGLIDAGIILYCAVVIFQAVTLPVEFNASRRALATLEGMNILEFDEIKGAKSVLRAAALTYVAAMVSVLVSLFRLLVLRNSRRD